MSPRAAALEAAPSSRSRPDRQLARSISVTWWYTMSGVLFLQLTVVVLATLVVTEADAPSAVPVVVAIGGIAWSGATSLLLLRYRRPTDIPALADWRTVSPPLVLCAGYAVAAGLLSGLWIIGGLAVVQPLMMLSWPRGVRLRMVVVSTLLLVGLWILDQQSPLRAAIEDERSSWWMFGSFAVILPVMSVLTLWWWDVLVSLDDARAAAGRLAATQERLRVATDVHDLQGHHLQVIALQLELAERLMERDPEAGMEQLRRARGSVDEARQGTRDIATRFRAVPLADEIANDPGATSAAGDATPESADGSGLAGIARRVEDAGGTVEVRRDAHEFAVIATVPEAAR
ncbi:MAG: histidine kinase [Microbacterium sp.]|nr:MAG: histidine kinase [Microbacterium sp.]